MAETDTRERVETLQQLIEKRLYALGGTTGPISLREAARRADGLLSHEVLRRLARGDHSGNIADKTAEGLSKALGVPVERVYRAAGVTAPVGPWVPPERFTRLTLEQRRLLEQVGNALLDAGLSHRTTS